MSGWHIGVIGGSGLAAGLALEHAEVREIAGPFGAPSGPVTTGTLPGRDGAPVRFSFIARHGVGHAIPPDAINYRANIDALKRCGVSDVVALSAVGSLREEMAPGQMVVVDQFIDRTVGRAASFFGPGCVAHVSMADPVCARLSTLVADAAGSAGASVHRGGCYVAIEGPQFSTRAESRMFRAWGADVIGMTAMPEARLAREAELAYAVLAMVTDWDCWRDAHAGVEAAEIFAVVAANAALARAAVAGLARRLPAERAAAPADTALTHAFATAPGARDAALVARLDAVAGRVLKG